MYRAIYTTALLTTLTAATPQWGGPRGGGNNGGNWGHGGPWAAFPSCVEGCRDQNTDYSNHSNLCDNTDTLSTLNSCVDSSSCSGDEKSDVKRAIAQLCANAGATITAAPYATYSVSSGGSAWPTAWTTNSAWASAVSAWGGPNGSHGGPGGWHGGAGGFGPFGPGGPRNGWGNGPWSSDGPWTSGAWTRWWGTDVCPTSTWSGWTDASWSTSAPWTSWSACTASTTATSTVTVTTTDTNGNQITSLSTSFGIRVAEATAGRPTDSDGDGEIFTDTRHSGAMPTAVLGSAAGVIGVLAGAMLL